MRLRKIFTGRFLWSHLLIIAFAGASTNVEVTKAPGDETPREKTSAVNRSSAPEHTTSALLKPSVIMASDRKLVPPIIIENLSRNRSDVFRPSVHLGEIEQTSTVRTIPFNNVQHVKFENNVQLDTRNERYQDIAQDTHEGVISVLDEATRPSRIKFEDERIIQTPSSVRYIFDDQRAVQTDSSSTAPFGEEVGVKQVFVDQMFYQNAEKPVAQDASVIYEKPTDDHALTASSHFDSASKMPYVVAYYTDNDQNPYQPLPQETAYEAMKKPDNGGVLLLQQQESTYTRKRKFPYQFYQPAGEYHHVEFIEEPQQSTAMAYPTTRKMSPWKKIIHLIGTFLPLGLLLATLTPKIVRINNTTQPNIVLSKLRAIDLPVEHKQARLLDDQSSICEGRSICELIVAGSEPGSNIVQNALWNLATSGRISDDVAKRNGLRGMFNAVRKKDCTMISC